MPLRNTKDSRTRQRVCMGAVFAIIRDLPTPQARRALFLIAIYRSLGRHYLGLPMHFDE